VAFYKALECSEPNYLINAYGPTENTTIANCYLADKSTMLNRGKLINIPIGKPIGNVKVYILDQNLNPVPLGVSGEIYIGGVGVALGYVNNEELTKERFLKDPFSSSPDARMYKTGDLGRWLPDGNIEFLGRNDFQVKIRGFRIELGEIEQKLLEIASVRESVVLALDVGEGDKRLVGYYVSGDSLEVSFLKEELSKSLPDYMVPSAFVRMESFPLTQNGKLDRKALPSPDGDSYNKNEYEAPQGEIEEKLAEIWQEVLKVERVGRNDNFFNLGGHSLLTIKLLEKMKQNKMYGDISLIFSSSTLKAMARDIKTDIVDVVVPENRIYPTTEKITPDMLPLISLTEADIEVVVKSVNGGIANIQDIYSLAPLQEGILYHSISSKGRDTYALGSIIDFDNKEVCDKFLEALEFVISRHDIMRTQFIWEGVSEISQVVLREASLRKEEFDSSSIEEDIGDHLFSKFERGDYRIDVTKAPLYRVVYSFDSKNNKWVMLMIWHHLLFDHTGLEVMFKEISAYFADETDHLPAPVPFRNLVARAKLGVSESEHQAFFTKMLGDIDEPTAPYGLLDTKGTGENIIELSKELEPDLSLKIRGIAKANGVTTAAIWHLVWGIVLSKLTGKDNVVFGTVLFGRMQGDAGASHAMGLFINTLPLRISVGECDVLTAVKSVHQGLSSLMKHEHATLTLAQGCSSVSGEMPLFSSLLNYRHNAVEDSGTVDESALSSVRFRKGEERTNYPFTFSVNDWSNGEFSLDFQSVDSVDSDRVLSYTMECLAGVVDAMFNNSRLPCSSVNIIPHAEFELLVNEFNDTKADFPADNCIHELFEEQVKLNPDKIAVKLGNITLTYLELNAQANKLSYYFKSIGVISGDYVGVYMERSPELIISLLAIMKAGGTYVSIDPAYPVDRVEYIIKDIGLSLVVSHLSKDINK
jgi:non-ribosomal peptide synthetase component F